MTNDSLLKYLGLGHIWVTFLLKITSVSISKGPPDAGPRVILSVDLWHPNVAAAERQALDFMFSPDL